MWAGLLPSSKPALPWNVLIAFASNWVMHCTVFIWHFIPCYQTFNVFFMKWFIRLPCHLDSCQFSQRFISRLFCFFQSLTLILLLIEYLHTLFLPSGTPNPFNSLNVPCQTFLKSQAEIFHFEYCFLCSYVIPFEMYRAEKCFHIQVIRSER